MKRLRFDFNGLFADNAGAAQGVTDNDLRRLRPAMTKAHRHLRSLIADDRDRRGLGLEWVRLPFQDDRTIAAIERLGRGIAAAYDNVISLGIGGSYLGLRAAQDALRPPYWNEFPALRRGRPRIYFDGNNLDPDTLATLLANLDPRRTFVIVISKSGETTETKAAFTVVERWLRRGVGARYGRQVIAITDPGSGALRARVSAAHKKDNRAFRSLPVITGVGGRFSELNIGLLHLAIIGVPVREVLAGAATAYRRCMTPDPRKNPALMYAALHTILYRRKGKGIAVMMPFAESLRSTADWYIQLLAESLGKKYARKIVRGPDGSEIWKPDTRRVVTTGRTPIAARGTNDLHSIQQNNIEGERNKVVTFIRVERFRHDIAVPSSGGLLAGKGYTRLLALAQEATEWALARESRPSCTVIMPEISPRHWGELIFFFEMATAYEGELLGVNAFDQPGVEGYKNYMYYKLRKPGIPAALAREIERHPVRRSLRRVL